MIDQIIPLLGTFVSSDLWSYILYPVFVLLFIVTVPCLIRGFFRR